MKLEQMADNIQSPAAKMDRQEIGMLLTIMFSFRACIA